MLIATKTKKDFKAVVKKLGYSLDEKLFDRNESKTVVNSERQAFGSSEYVKKGREIISAEEFLKDEEQAPEPTQEEKEAQEKLEGLRALYKEQHKKDAPVKFKNNVAWLEKNTTPVEDVDLSNNEEE